MYERERFEQLKHAFIIDTTIHLEEIRKLQFDGISNVSAGVKLVELRSKAVASSILLADFISKQRFDNLTKKNT